jgi:MFS family permease
LLIALFVAAELIQKRPMVDFALFRKRTFLGAAFAMLGFASAAQVMMTYLPLYLQNAFSLSPAAAGLGMLPFALPLFFCPRIAVALANRISGRDLLALGLAIVAAGNVATALMAGSHLSYGFVALGMLATGCGAGLLNGETAKVSMSVIPPERGGMASGIGGTLRFVGRVTGITGLGAVLSSETERRFVHSAPRCICRPLLAMRRIRLSRGSWRATFQASWRKRPSRFWRRWPNCRGRVSAPASRSCFWSQALSQRLPPR